jgi:hypothetical protein
VDKMERTEKTGRNHSVKKGIEVDGIYWVEK